MSKRVCLEPGCPNLTDRGRCPEHRRQAERARGSSTARGYDAEHQRERAKWQAIVDRRGWPCGRCGGYVQPGDAWDLDHDDDRSGYLGPSHQACNRAAPRLSQSG